MDFPHIPEKQKKGGRRENRRGNSPLRDRNQFIGSVMTTILIFILISSIYSWVSERGKKEVNVSLSTLAEDIAKGKVERISVKGGDVVAQYVNEKEPRNAKKEIESSFTETLKNYGVSAEALQKVNIEIEEPSGFSFWFFNLAPIIFPILFIALFIWFLSRQVRGAGMQAFSFGQSKARITFPDDKKQKVTFKDVAGAKEAKEELKEIVDFLKNPKKFLEIGAQIPKGVLLMGASGTGKTLLARAVAGEAGVPFFSISGSEFVEMFVGVGASVTGDTPVLIKNKEGVKLITIGEFVNSHYKNGETDVVVPVDGVQTLGFKKGESKFWGSRSKEKFFFGGSTWSSMKAVYRHKIDKIYRIKYRGGEIKTTGDHSVFVRERNMIRAKRADELTKGDILVNLPFKVRSSFVHGVGTTHKIYAHEERASHDSPYFIDVYNERYQIVMADYEYALAGRDTETQNSLAACIGVSQSTVKNWQLGRHTPRFFRSNVFRMSTPSRVEVTPDLMRLLGYYTAEGRTEEYYTQFVFGLHEKKLHEDCIQLIRRFFKFHPSVKEVPETNSLRITISSPIIADFFEKQCGTGSHRKHIPEMLWTLSKEHFLSYLRGYSLGDGYTTREGKLSTTSVSKRLIMELAWLCSMHGIQVGMRRTSAPEGRRINNGKPLPETISWNLIIGKSSHPFFSYEGSPSQFKKPIIEEIEVMEHDGYVYDLCGCDNEAFFGGEKPVLLHNSRVRDLFKMAKQAAPAIIFVDEIDAVGRVRGTGVGGGNDEREQTLNQILVEMDGFEQNEKVIVMAATNRPDVLDPALVRPGRFDRRVVIDLPDRSDREEILKIHSAKKPFAEDVNLKVVAERTPGFSGADLYSLMNEGAILAARENRTKVAQFDLIRSIEKVMLGPERRSHLLSKKEKEITAYHEAGHALVASVLPFADPVHKISIISRGRAAGYTLKLPFEDRKLQSRNEFLDDIAMSLGGYVTEKMVFGDITTGPSNDLQVSTALARDMVTKYGMSDKIGPIALEGAGGRVMFGRGVEENVYSERVGAEIDSEVSKIITDALKKAEDILVKYRSALDAIAAKLIEVETIEREAYEQIITAFGIIPKKKQDIEHQA